MEHVTHAGKIKIYIHRSLVRKHEETTHISEDNIKVKLGQTVMNSNITGHEAVAGSCKHSH